MEALFIKLLNMSITASYIILAVIVLRFLLKKAPKKINCILWTLVAIRLVCPFSFESVLSLIPTSNTVTTDILYADTPMINSGISIVNNTVNSILASFGATPEASVNPMQVYMYIASIVWIVGMACLVLYSIITYLKLKHKVATAIPMKDNIYRCDTIASPFVIGIIKPKIYIPFTIDETNLERVIAHEKAHIKRHDHWIKPFGFLLMSVYWFNPLVWVAYILLCRDIELACDEKVLEQIGVEEKKNYSKALLDCSVNCKSIAMCPLAFGEVGVKQRVKNILNYKKPAFWIIVIAIISCVVVGVCFLTNPTSNNHLSGTATSTKFSNNEINDAMDCVKKKFKDFKGCELTDLWYDEEKSDAFIEGYLESGEGSINGVDAENVIVLLSNFNVDSTGGDGSLNPNSTYSNWNWILIRDRKTGNWLVDDWGY